MVSFLIFSGLLTGFIQINTNYKISADTEYFENGSYVFDLNKNLELTNDLTSDVAYHKADIHSKQKINKVRVNALKLDEKTIVIKGFNEVIDENLLKVIDLNINNIKTSTTTEEFDNLIGSDIVPITIDVITETDFVEELSDKGSEIFEYEVASGDNVSSIAKKFNISTETILWANDLNSKSSIKIGQKLVILPVSGVSYKVKKGDTISGIAVRFDVKERDIVDFNKTENNKLIIGETIIIPGGKISTSGNLSNKNTNTTVKNNSTPSVNIGLSGMARPIHGGIKTQGIHGNNAVDIGAPIGTSVFASLEGTVTLTRGGNGWNGGYGNYIVIKHPNGVQTLYAHLNDINVEKGDYVNKGQVIGKSGNSGRSSGPHLHFEVRGAKNPF